MSKVINKYTHLVDRVEYHQQLNPLPDWIHITITDDEEGEVILEG